MSEYLQATVTVLSLINPVVAASIFVRLEKGRSSSEQFSDAGKAALAVAMVLFGAALVGARLLDLFGVSMDAFSVAGGAVLAWMGFGMIRGGGSSHNSSEDKGSAAAHSLTPLILFAASPGTITGVITLAVAHTGTELPVTAMVAVAIAVAVTWVVLLLSRHLGKRKQGLVQQLVPKLMGLLVLSMGLQFGLSGLKSFMAG